MSGWVLVKWLARLPAIAKRRLPWLGWGMFVLIAGTLVQLHEVSTVGQQKGMVTLAEAWASLPHDPYQWPRRVRLPHVLDDESPAWWGRVSYRLEWPDNIVYVKNHQARWALLLPRVGPRFRVLLNGSEIAQMGWYAEPTATVLSTAQPHFVTLPASLLAEHAHRNQLIIEVLAHPLERGGLAPVQLGEHDVVQRRYRTLEWWQMTGAWIMATQALFVGVLALLLWRALKERLFVLMGLVAIAVAARTMMLVWIEPPLSHELMFLLHRFAFAAFVAFFLMMMEEFLAAGLHAVRAVARWMLAMTPVWIGFAQWIQSYTVVRAWAVAITVTTLVSFMVLLYRVRKRLRYSPTLVVVAMAAAFALFTGVRDLVVVQFGLPGDGELRWLTFGSIVLIFALGAALVERATRWARDVQRLNASLADAVTRREQELRLAFEQLKQAEEHRIVEEERRRLMRDMHDGLGSQLVQTLNLVRNAEGNLAREPIEAMLRQALDELRLTLDSLEPMEGDLPTILGTFRRRLQPALESAGLNLRWEVQDVPVLPSLDAQGVLHLFRILQEVLANVVKHARARNITISTATRDQQVILTVEDDGVGLPPPEHRLQGGRGLRNIITRATRIGATVRFFDAHPGCGIELAFGLGDGTVE